MCRMVGLQTMWMKILVELHIVDYSVMFVVQSACFDVYVLIISLLSMCEVIVLHMYIVLVDLE